MPDWGMVKRVRHAGPAPRRSARADLDRAGSAGKPKVSKAKGHTSGRTYTSKYRGVHQTFPTKRWEAQFRCACPRLLLSKYCHAQLAVCQCKQTGHGASLAAYDKRSCWAA